MGQLDPFRFTLTMIGAALGYASGRLIWSRSGRFLSPFRIIAILAFGALLTLQVANALGVTVFWNQVFFPVLIGWGAGLAITPARLPRESAWWQIWKR